MGWTPYHYCENDPVNAEDGNGRADYVAPISDKNDDIVKISDGNDADKTVYAVNDKILKANYNKESKTYNFESIQAFAYIIPYYILTTVGSGKHFSSREGMFDKTLTSEGASVGDTKDWVFGGRQNGVIEQDKATCSDVMNGAISNYKKSHDGHTPLFFEHDHPYGYESGPSTEDRLTVQNCGFRFGIVIYLNNFTFFGSNDDSSWDVRFTTKQLEKALQP